MEWLILIGVLFLFVRFTIVKEGTAKALMKLGAFSEIFMQWQEHWMDREWNVHKKGEKGKKKKNFAFGKIFGGLYFYIWPIYNIYKYPLRWTDLRRIKEAEGTIEETQFHDEKGRDYVMLKPAVYWTKLFSVETRPPERVPLIVEILVTFRIINPFLFLFVAPPTPLEDALARLDAVMRAKLSSLKLDDVLYMKGKSDVLWEGEKGATGLKDEKLIKKTLPSWGIKIAKHGIQFKRIDLTPEYQKAAAARRTQQMKAEGRAEEIIGTVVSAVARAGGVKEKEVQKKFKENPVEFYAKHRPIIDATMRKISIEGKASISIETPGATGIKADFLQLLAAFKGMPTPGAEQEQKEKEREKDKIKESEEKTKKESEEKEKEPNIEEIEKKMAETLTGKKKNK
jgi:regulator of protease activity HflC (stomatin/prohibitin superfamily)